MRLADETPEASAWLDEIVAAHKAKGRFNQVKPSIIWSDIKDKDGKLIVDIDPDSLVSEINSGKFPHHLGHDPGHPLGKLLESRKFNAPSGEQFIAAVMGLYAGKVTSFADLLVQVDAEFPSPTNLPFFEIKWINLSIDPREFPNDWVEDVVTGSQFPIRATAASNNAQKPPHQLIRVGVLFVTLVWNPYVSTIASEAGKDTYAGIRTALERIVEKASKLENPILEIQSHHSGCEISFVLRREGVQTSYEAMAKLPLAASQAEHLVANLTANGNSPKLLVYEFDHEANRWYPSFAELNDGTLVTDNEKLIAVEELPTGFSLGLVSTRNEPTE